METLTFVCSHHHCTNPIVKYVGLWWWYCYHCKSEWYHDCHDLIGKEDFYKISSEEK